MGYYYPEIRVFVCLSKHAYTKLNKQRNNIFNIATLEPISLEEKIKKINVVLRRHHCDYFYAVNGEDDFGETYTMYIGTKEEMANYSKDGTEG